MANYTVNTGGAIVRGTVDADNFVISASSVYITSFDGTDTFSGGTSFSVIDGGNGYDDFHLDPSSHTVLFGGADDSPDRMQILGGSQNQLFGGGGDDWINASVYLGINPSTPSEIYLDGGTGNDIIQLGGNNSALFGDDGIDALVAYGSNNHLYGGENTNTPDRWEFLYVSGNNNFADGGNGDDQVYAEIGTDNLLFGGAGTDWVGSNGQSSTLDGGAGSDFVGVSGSANALFGGDDNDVVYANGTSNVLVGGDGNDWVGVSGTGNALFGGLGNDTLGASGGFDLLVGGPGDDRITFNSGHNTILFEPGDGHDTLLGFVPGAVSTDVIRIQGFGLAALPNLIPYMKVVGNDTVITLGGDVITIANVNNLFAYTPDDFLLVG